MTVQFPDTVAYLSQEYSIAGHSGKGLFDPNNYGMKPAGRCDACQRGFTCSYRVEGDALLLHSLNVYLDRPAPLLFGVTPDADREVTGFDATYTQLNHKVSYSGGLLLGRDVIKKLVVHAGIHPVWKHREVLELIFEDGHLVQETDRSRQIAELRRLMLGRPSKPTGPENREAMQRWIERCFGLDYEYTW